MWATLFFAIICILVGVMGGLYLVFLHNRDDDPVGFWVMLILSITMLALGGFGLGCTISDMVEGVVEYKAEEYYLDYKITTTQVGDTVVQRDTTYVLTKRD